MRWHLLTVFLLTSFAMAQNAQQPAAPSTSGMVITGGYASTPTQAPSILTPHVTLGVASANPVGATSSASGLQVGASSAALPPAVSQQAVSNQAIVTTGEINSGNTRTGIGPVGAIVAPGPQTGANTTASTQEANTAVVAPARSNESQPDVAAAARYYREHHQRAVKTYTNDDINRLNDQTNTASSGANSALPASDMSAPAAAPTSNPAATMPATDQTQQAPAAQAPAAPEPKKPAPYTPPQTPPQ
jgi:hypothetical protein